MSRRAWVLWLAVAGCSAGRSPLAGGDRDLGGHLSPYDGSTSFDLSSGSRPDLAGLPSGNLAADLAGAVLPPSIVTDPTAIYVHEAKTLYTVDPTTFDLTTVGDFGVTDDLTDLAIDPDGHLIAISATSLYGVDAASGHASLLADKIFTNMNALAYLSDGADGADGRLLSADVAGNVYELTLSGTPTVQTLGAYGGNRTTAGDLVAVDDGTLWGLTNGGTASDSNNALMIVNNVDGHATVLGATGFGELGGSAYSNGRIVAFSSTGQVVGIDPSTGAGTLLKTHAGKSFVGAASAPSVLQ